MHIHLHRRIHPLGNGKQLPQLRIILDLPCNKISLLKAYVSVKESSQQFI
jgi:hypothetical protein